jgi:hypothetical protein
MHSWYSVGFPEVIDTRMAISRNRSAGAKVTDEEYMQLEALAQARGVTLGEWCREVLLAQVSSEAITDDEAVLGEVLALRMITLNLFRALGNGEKLNDAKIQEIVQWADREKRDIAKDRLKRK